LHNIADQHLDRVKAMAAAYAEWAKFVGVLPWPMPQTPPAQQHFMDSADYLRDDRI
jgi:hypothetical protein